MKRPGLRRGALLWLAFLAVQGMVWLLEASPPPRRPLGDEALYRAAAVQLLETGTTDLSPLWPPFYILFLAALRWLGQGSWMWVPWLQLGLLVAAAWLLRRLCRRLLGDGPESDGAAALMLIYPPLVAFSHYYWPEVLHLVMMLALAEILLSGRRGVGWMLGFGALLGLAVATKALLMPWVPLLLWWCGGPGDRWSSGPWGVKDRHGQPTTAPDPRPAGRFWPRCWATVGLACVVLPLASWNQQRVGVWTLSDSVAFNLWVGLEDVSNKSFVDGVAGREYRTFLESGATFEERQAVLWDKIQGKVDDIGWSGFLGRQFPKQYHRLFDRDSYFTDQLPGGVIAQRGQGYRSPPPIVARLARTTSHGLYLGLLLLACVGVAVSAPSRRPWLYAVLAFLGYNLLLFLFLHVKSRYRIQLMPWCFLYATLGATWCWRRMRGVELPAVLRLSATDPRWLTIGRAGGGLLGMLAFLYFAFSA